MEIDGLSWSDGGVLDQQLDCVRAAIVGAVQKGRNSTKKRAASVLGRSAWALNRSVGTTAGDLRRQAMTGPRGASATPGGGAEDRADRGNDNRRATIKGVYLCLCV